MSGLLFIFLFAFFPINTFLNPFTKNSNQPNFIKIHGKHIQVYSSVPITWKSIGNSSLGLVEATGDGSEYEAKLFEKDSFSTLIFQKASSNTTNSKSIQNSFYSDELARSKMLFLSAAAYNDKPEVCLNRTLPNITLHKSVNFTCDTYGKDDICAGFTAVSHKDKAIIVAFRGTSAFTQLIFETSETALQNQVKSPIGGKVGHYFADVFKRLWFNESIGKDFESLQHAYSGYDLWLTGHSLGGALASLAAAQIVADGQFNVSKIKLYTFGQPRTGDADYADALDFHLLTNSSFRVTHSRDPVVHLPAHSFKNYTHHKAEVWYSNNMTPNKTYTVCNEQEGKNCSGKIEYVFYVPDHLYYFNIHVSNFGKTGCQNGKKQKNRWSWFGWS